MNEILLNNLITLMISVAISAAAGGYAAYLAIRVDVAVLQRIFNEMQKGIDKAHAESNHAHRRLDEHITEWHKGQG